MELIEKTPEKISIVSDMNVSLANAIRRSVNEIPILAIDEADIYKNDSVLYDEIIAHRLGLIPLKNQSIKADQSVEMKLSVKGKGDVENVLAGELGDSVVYPEMPIVLIGDGQEVELVARARVGKGINHAKFSPGIVFYKHLAKIKISGDGERQSELAEIYPEVFEMFGEKLKIKNAAACDLDQGDMEIYPGVTIGFDDNIVFTVESWGQLEVKDIFTDACKALKGNLSEVSKVIK
ncbi:DNA-directed RNA polymerase subunit D [Candidatus Pacearchaeota archaeon]|nr:DNA-directed RNA polymerase subunit D [Candidatus Pacearchaeota archaeon]